MTKVSPRIYNWGVAKYILCSPEVMGCQILCTRELRGKQVQVLRGPATVGNPPN